MKKFTNVLIFAKKEYVCDFNYQLTILKKNYV